MIRTRGFTLIELLVVVSVIAVLAAIAIPNFLEAQTRAKVSAARGNQRTLRTALEAYRVDYNNYPPTLELPDDPLAILSSAQLWRLTTPVAFTSPDAFRDPFGTPKMYSALENGSQSGPIVFPENLPPNKDRAMLYFDYQSSARRFGDPRFANAGVCLVSIGPDVEDSLGAYSMLSNAFFQQLFLYAQLGDPIDTLYDPTNGTLSSGDIVSFAGDVRKGE